MAIEIKLPELGDGIESGDVLDILVAEGDMIEKDQGVVELETDKATVEVPTTHAGKVAKIHVSMGDSVPIGGVLITVEAVEAKAAAPPVEAAPAPPAAPTPARVSTSPPQPVAPPPVEEPAETAAAVASPPASPIPPPIESDSRPAMRAAEVAAGPAIRRLAREVGVDLHLVTGTGADGRITREDVLAIVRQASQAAQSGAETGAERDEWGPVRLERMTKIRKTIAKKMHESWSTVPRVTNFDDADITDLEEFRQQSKADYAERGIKLTAMPFLIKAVAKALGDHPAINASLDTENGQIIYKDYVNIGIAVDTDRGLVVPSLRSADKLAIPDIASQLMTLAENVRNKSFSLEDLRGSTFTISNLGAIGGAYSTPIINVPEVAILLVGRSRKLPVVIDDRIEIRLMMPLSLSYDHRLVDGGTAGRFLNDVIGYLKAPSRLLLSP